MQIAAGRRLTRLTGARAAPADSRLPDSLLLDRQPGLLPGLQAAVHVAHVGEPHAGELLRLPRAAVAAEADHQHLGVAARARSGPS